MGSQTGIISTASNPRAWARDFDDVVFDNYELVPDVAGLLINQGKAKNSHFIKRGLDVTIGNAREMREGQPVQFDAFIDGPQKQVTPTKFGLGIQATLEAHRDDRIGHIKTAQAQLAKAMAVTLQIKQNDLFNSAFSTSRLGIDGKALCATDHPFYGTQGGTVSNVTTGALSKTTLQDAINKFNKLVDERNRPVMMSPRVLVVPPDLEWIAKELLGTELEVGTANNTINSLNVVNGGKGTNYTQKLQYVVNRYLTSSTAWFLLSDKSMHDLQHIVFDPVTSKTYIDDNTDNVIYKVTSRWVDSFWMWRGIVGSTGL